MPKKPGAGLDAATGAPVRRHANGSHLSCGECGASSCRCENLSGVCAGEVASSQARGDCGKS
eukprot:4248687-Pyramimonas_sp.AAC.1